MDLQTFNPALERTGIIDVTPSLIWHRKFFTPGSFELTVPATDINLALLQPYHLLYKPGAAESGYIHSIVIEDTEDKGEMITATGSFLSGWLSNRTILANASTLAQLITQECISTSAARKISGLKIGICENIPIGVSIKGKNLGAVLEALARRDNFGYRIRFDVKTRELLFETFRGVDRSVEQSVNPRVQFSQQYDNLISSTYTWSDVGSCDTVYCNITGLGGVEYTSLPSYSIEGKTGNQRVETTVDVQAVTYDYKEEVTGNIYPNPVYIMHTYLDSDATLAKMREEAQKALAPVAENFEGSVRLDFGYKTDFDLGDVATILHQGWGKKTSQRITEVTEVYDNETNSIIPVFGNPAPTIMDLLKE